MTALTDTLLCNYIIPEEQNGALPDKGTDACLHMIISAIFDANLHNKPLFITYIDFKKAFDSVEHWILEAILTKLNLHHYSEIIHNLLTDTYINLKYNNQVFSDNIHTSKGTKQGDVISPILFILFISPLIWALKNNVKGYSIKSKDFCVAGIMDDIACITSDPQEMSKAMEIVNTFCNITGMKIGIKKCAFSYINSNTNYELLIGEELVPKLAPDESYKYLGIHLNLRLDWSKQMSTSEACLRATLSTIEKKFYLNPMLQVKLVNQVAIPSIGYRSQVITFPEEWL